MSTLKDEHNGIIEFFRKTGFIIPANVDDCNFSDWMMAVFNHLNRDEEAKIAWNKLLEKIHALGHSEHLSQELAEVSVHLPSNIEFPDWKPLEELLELWKIQ